MLFILGMSLECRQSTKTEAVLETIRGNKKRGRPKETNQKAIVTEGHTQKVKKQDLEIMVYYSNGWRRLFSARCACRHRKFVSE